MRQDIKLLREDKLEKSLSAPLSINLRKKKMSWNLFVLNHNNINVHHVLFPQQSLNLTFDDFFLTFPSFSSVQSSQVWISFEFRFGVFYSDTNIFLSPQIICISYSSSDNREQGRINLDRILIFQSIRIRLGYIALAFSNISNQTPSDNSRFSVL